jgi:hypothetical protein
MDARMNVVEVNFKKAPYNLQLWLTEDLHDGQQMWRFSMALRWLPDGPQAEAWRSLAATEQVAARKGETRQLLEKADIRGL